MIQMVMILAATALISQSAQDSEPSTGLVRAPTQAQYSMAYPPRALQLKQDGQVSLQCGVEPAGGLTNCVVAQESPIGFNFGVESLKLAPFIRMGPGPFPLGQTVTVPLTWTPNGSSPSLISSVDSRLNDDPIKWLRTPSGADYLRLYPERAARMRKGGQVTMSCIVASDGFLSDCQTAAETPAGFGFGEATLKLAPIFQMGPTSGDHPVGGAKVSIPLSWVMR
jgi:hypothetical protein